MVIDQPIKLCECGCGKPAPIAKQTQRSQGHVKGQPVRFILGHSARKNRDMWARISARCVWEGDCFIWTGAHRNANGYGAIEINGKLRPVHCVVYEYFKGPIPAGLTIDHVKDRGCHSRSCCNIEHLEAVTSRVNTLRGNNPAARNARKTHCPLGHALLGENLVQSALPWRICRSCANAQQREAARWRRQRTR